MKSHPLSGKHRLRPDAPPSGDQRNDGEQQPDDQDAPAANRGRLVLDWGDLLLVNRFVHEPRKTGRRALRVVGLSVKLDASN